MSLCDRDMCQLLCNWIIMNMIFMKGIWNLYYVKKETLSQAFSCKFCEFLRRQLHLRLFANCATNFWTTASRVFIIELAVCGRDKNHKFDDFKTHKNLFLNEVAFYFIWLLHCIKVSASLSIQTECGKMQTLFRQCCAIRDAN